MSTLQSIAILLLIFMTGYWPIQYIGSFTSKKKKIHRISKEHIALESILTDNSSQHRYHVTNIVKITNLDAIFFNIIVAAQLVACQRRISALRICKFHSKIKTKMTIERYCILTVSTQELLPTGTTVLIITKNKSLQRLKKFRN